MSQLIQIVGAVLILVAYTLSQMRRLEQDSVLYLTLNFVGSALLGVLAWLGHQWGFLLLEGVWALVSAIGLIRRLRGTD